MGDELTVGGLDVAARTIEVAGDGPTVAGLLVQFLRVDDLQEVELHEERQVARHQCDRELPELPVHAVTAITVVWSS